MKWYTEKMNPEYFLKILCLICFFSLSACDMSSDTYAPVADLSGIEKIPKAGMHHVATGETLYSIAFRFGLDYRKLAAWNNIKPPYTIQKNQWISLHQQYAFSKQARQNISVANKMTREPDYSVSQWKWPARGKIIHGFSSGNKGINIAGPSGEAIFSVASGKVVYSGDGLRAYGNLIIIKHNNLYLSAYAHCRSVLVKEGDWVRQGQKIAEMGRSGSDKTMLHFEIRRAGKPIDPLSLFQNKIA